MNAARIALLFLFVAGAAEVLNVSSSIGREPIEVQDSDNTGAVQVSLRALAETQKKSGQVEVPSPMMLNSKVPSPMMTKSESLHTIWKASNLSTVKWLGEAPSSIPLFSKSYERCALVSNAGSLLLHQHGPDIDEAGLILRMNDAPTAGYEKFVGSKEHLRMVNSEATKEILAGGGASNYTPSENVVLLFIRDLTSQAPKYIEKREMVKKLQAAYPSVKTLMGDNGLHPPLQHALTAIYPCDESCEDDDWAPTSGTMGMLLLLPLCKEVRAYGLAHTKSTLSAPYHYYGAGLHWDPGSYLVHNKTHKMFLIEKALWSYLAENTQADIDRTDVAKILGSAREKSNSSKSVIESSWAPGVIAAMMILAAFLFCQFRTRRSAQQADNVNAGEVELQYGN